MTDRTEIYKRFEDAAEKADHYLYRAMDVREPQRNNCHSLYRYWNEKAADAARALKKFRSQ